MNVLNNLKALEAVRPVIDIAVLAFVLYKAYTLLVKTNAMQIIRAAVVIGLAYVLAAVFRLSTMMWLLGLMAPALVIVAAVIFQPELRKIFLKLGQSTWFSFGERSKHNYIDSVLIAAEELSGLRRGMLVVFARRTSLSDIMDSGTPLNADISSGLLVTIFKYDTPLHDGAAIIQGGKITKAGCFSTHLSEQQDIKATFGTRHRAAIGISEETDAVILVVSEESGAISLAYDSKLHYDLTREQLRKILDAQLGLKPDALEAGEEEHGHKT